jgi:eukaryotic-like serine/threonine-protein kinase
MTSNPFGGNPFDAARTESAPPVHPMPPVGRGEVNTLATLSVVFAFVFAPAGAILGHLGLGQISAGGQRGRERALVGVTLSYAFITAAIVALVVWVGLRDNTIHQAAPTITADRPAVTATTTTTLPPPPTVGAADLAALLPGIEQVRDFATDPDLTVNKTDSGPDFLKNDSNRSTYDNDDCKSYLGAANAVEKVQTVTGYLGVDTRETKLLFGPTQAYMALVAFPDAASAQAQLASELAGWRRCDGISVTQTDPAKNVFVYHLGSSVAAGNGITTMEETETRQVPAVGMLAQSIHATAAKANVYIDLFVLSYNDRMKPKMSNAATSLATFILSKIPS